MASSFSSFSADKRGYNSYIKSLGINLEPGMSAVSCGAMSLPEFVQAVKMSPENQINELYLTIERLNDTWFELIQKGQDDNNIENDAYHIKHNLRRYVYQLEKLEKSVK